MSRRAGTSSSYAGEREQPADPRLLPAARAVRLTKVYGSGQTAVTALRDIDLEFPRGRFTAIMGPSGSGKSTLMHCLAGLDTVTKGRVYVGDIDLSRLSDKQLTRLRRDRIGFVFQQFNLLPTLTAAENITLPLDIAGRQPDRKWMRLVVDAVGLAPRLSHRPSELSGGQQQRVACARALITRPEIIFADEPTGNLDSRSSGELLSFLGDSVRELGQTVVMVTHDPTAASYSDEVLFLADGRVVDSMPNPTAEGVLDRMKHLEPAAEEDAYDYEPDADPPGAYDTGRRADARHGSPLPGGAPYRSPQPAGGTGGYPDHGQRRDDRYDGPPVRYPEQGYPASGPGRPQQPPQYPPPGYRRGGPSGYPDQPGGYPDQPGGYPDQPGGYPGQPGYRGRGGVDGARGYGPAGRA
jgi:putative ABC transport system ATP-binding protein